MVPTIPSAFWAIFFQFSCVFTAPSFQNFLTVITGWILCTGRHTISRVIQFGSGPASKKHFSSLYRFFSRAAWDVDALGEVLVKLVLPLIPGDVVFASVDDTLCRKSGPHLWGAAMHYDPLHSTYGKGTTSGRKTRFTFGHNWVIVCLWVPLPWNAERGLALPVMFRLYRSKKRCPENQHRTRTQLASEMISILASWIPRNRTLIVLGDSEYACQTLVKGSPPNILFIGPMAMNAALFDFPGAYAGRGRHRKKGRRLLSPRQLAEDRSVRWKRCTLSIYGRQVEALIKTQVCLWYHVAGTKPIRMIVTRDPKGRIEDRAYFATDPEFTPQQIAAGFARRWPQEVMRRDTKQTLGLEDPQNGWWRRRHGTRSRKKRPGPQPHRNRGHRAVLRTVPIALTAYTLVAVWYFQHGTARKDVKRVQENAPWYRHKAEPSFDDMLNAARLELWKARFSATPTLKKVSSKFIEVFPCWLLAS